MIPPIVVNILGNDKLSAKLGLANKSMSKFGRKTTQVGKSMTMGLTAPIVGVGAAVLHTAGNFQEGMNMLEVSTGANTDQFKTLRAEALKLGSDTAFSATEATEGMQALSDSGYDVGQIMQSIGPSLDLATAGNLELGTAADFASDVMNAFGLDASKARESVDILARGSKAGATTLDKMIESFSQFGPVLHQTGISLHETTKAIAILGSGGRKASNAGTDLKAVVLSLVKPSGEARAALRDLGIARSDLFTGPKLTKLKSLENIFKHLKKAGATTKDLGTIFRRTGAAGAGALMQAIGGGWEAAEKKMQNKSLTAQKLAEARMKGLNGGIRRLKAAFEAFSIAVGDSGLLEWAAKIVNKFAKFFVKISQWSPKLLTLGVILAGVAATIGPVLIAVGLMSSGIGVVAGAIGSFIGFVGGLGAKLLYLKGTVFALIGFFGWWLIPIAAVGAGIYLLIKNWDTFATSDTWKNIKLNMSEIWGLMQKLGGLAKSFGMWWAEAGKIAGSVLVTELKLAWEWVKRIASAIENSFVGKVFTKMIGLKSSEKDIETDKKVYSGFMGGGFTSSKKFLEDVGPSKSLMNKKETPEKGKLQEKIDDLHIPKMTSGVAQVGVTPRKQAEPILSDPFRTESIKTEINEMTKPQPAMERPERWKGLAQTPEVSPKQKDSVVKVTFENAPAGLTVTSEDQNVETELDTGYTLGN